MLLMDSKLDLDYPPALKQNENLKTVFV